MSQTPPMTIDSEPTGNPPPDPGDVRPVGRDEVRQALIEAAMQLFAAHGPRAVSMRQVAAQADVNYGLIHRHFGSKEALLDETVDHGAAALSNDLAEVTRADEALEVLQAHADYWRLLAFACLESDDGAELHREFPTVAGLIERLRAVDPDSDDIGLRAAAGTALALGWVVFEPFLRVAADLGDTDGSVLIDGLSAALERAVGVGIERETKDRVEVPARPQ